MPSEMIHNSNSQRKRHIAPRAAKSINCTASETTSFTPRFTSEEKKILYSLFRQHEDVIDIKSRKKQKGKHSIRDAWQSIVNSFNEHPSVSTDRHLKQIQKFWLNARLRKHYPSKSTKDTSIKQRSSTPFKCKTQRSFPLRNSSGIEENNDKYKEIELQPISLTDIRTIESLEDSTENVQIQQGKHDRNLKDSIQLQLLKNSRIKTKNQLNVDHISPEKLTLNDLLQFKNNQPDKEIIFQIKQPEVRSITFPSPNRIPQQQNELIGEIRVQPHIEVQHYESPLTQQIQHQSNAYATQNQQHAMIVSNIGAEIHSEIGNSNGLSVSVTESFEDKINYLKLKEIELRNKEVQLLSEEKRIELTKMQEELRHKKEMHCLQVEEMQIRLRILCEEEKELIIKAS